MPRRTRLLILTTVAALAGALFGPTEGLGATELRESTVTKPAPGATSFGARAALSPDGGFAVVGATGTWPANDGAGTWVLARGATGWSVVTQLTASAAPVAISRDAARVVVGTSVFARSGGGWVPDGPPLGGEVTATAISDDGATLLAGRGADDEYAGSVTIFTRTSAGWQPERVLTGLDDGNPGSGQLGVARFGYAVDLSADGSTALIGAPADGGTYEDQWRGAAWVFVRSAAGWTQQQKITGYGDGHVGSGQSGRSRFGDAVALSASGDVALVGAYADARGCHCEMFEGAAWIFRRTGGAWTQEQRVTGTGDGNVGAGEIGYGNFGSRLAISGDGATALIGALGEDTWTGGVWQIRRTDAGWSQVRKLTPAPRGTYGQAWFGDQLGLDDTGRILLITESATGGGSAHLMDEVDVPPTVPTSGGGVTTPAAKPAPRAVSQLGRVRIGRRALRITLTCRAATCRGTLILQTRGRTPSRLGFTRYRVAAGRSAKVALKLNARGRRAVRRRARATLVHRPVGGTTQRRPLTLAP